MINQYFPFLSAFKKLNIFIQKSSKIKKSSKLKKKLNISYKKSMKYLLSKITMNIFVLFRSISKQNFYIEKVQQQYK